jgi:hypothetical protein
MRYLTLALGLVALGALGACDDDPDINTDRDTASDPFGDIAALGTAIYATNDDQSGNAGSQVGLFPFALDGTPAGAELVLDLNGCGYLAMTADDKNLLLQIRDTGRVICVTPAGGLLWNRTDTEMADDGWRACGICRRPGAAEVVALYTQNDTTFVARTYNLDLTEVVATTDEFGWDGLPPPVFPRALVHDGDQWVVLASDADGANLTITLDSAFEDLGTPVAEAANMTGLAVAGGWYYAAFDDGTIGKLRPVVTR